MCYINNKELEKGFRTNKNSIQGRFYKPTIFLCLCKDNFRPEVGEYMSLLIIYYTIPCYCRVSRISIVKTKNNGKIKLLHKAGAKIKTFQQVGKKKRGRHFTGPFILLFLA